MSVSYVFWWSVQNLLVYFCLIQIVVLCPGRGEADDVWSEWSNWSACSVECGGGHQYRTRTCEGRAEECEGLAHMSRNCNTQKCRGLWILCLSVLLYRVIPPRTFVFEKCPRAFIDWYVAGFYFLDIFWCRSPVQNFNENPLSSFKENICRMIRHDLPILCQFCTVYADNILN